MKWESARKGRRRCVMEPRQVDTGGVLEGVASRSVVAGDEAGQGSAGPRDTDYHAAGRGTAGQCAAGRNEGGRGTAGQVTSDPTAVERGTTDGRATKGQGAAGRRGTANPAATDRLLACEPVPTAFLRLAIPAVAAQLINILYNLVDKMFIGHIPQVGEQALAGVGVTAPVILAISAFAALVSMGGAPKASIYLGQGEREQAERVVGACTWMLIVVSIVLTLGMLAFGRPVLMIFGASDSTISFAVGYMNVYCLGTLFEQLTLGLNAFITAEGKTLVSMANVAVGAVVNVIFDALFINVLGMGVAGAALATVVAQGVSACCVLRFLCCSRSTLRLRGCNVRPCVELLWPCILLGTSPALMQLTENLVAISFNTALQTFGGDTAVASMSILTSIMQFVMLLLPGLVQGAQPLLSYNLGAGDIPRVKKTFRLLLTCCVGGSFLIWLLCMTVPGAVASIFTDDAQLIEYTAWSMRIYLAVLLIYGVQVACQYSFVALDQAKKAIFLTVWRKIILLIPLIFIMPHLCSNPVAGVYLAEPIADTIAVCTTAPIFYRYYRRLG